MKIQISRITGTLGSALLVTLCAAIVIGLTLASYLILVQTQSTNVERSQKWNNVMVVTEAGVEDALEMVNKYAGTPNLDNWTNTFSDDGWTANGNVYSVTRYLNLASNCYYTVYVTNVYNAAAQQWAPSISAVGYVPGPFSSAQATPQTLFAAAGLGASTALGRRVVVQTTRDPMFNFALAAQKQINMKGNDVATDSFDSSNTNYSNADGTYNPSKNKGGGDVVSNDTITNTISIGNANIMGHAKTGPNGTVSVGPNGWVGSTSFVTAQQPTATGSHIESGYASSDLNVDFPDVPSPDAIYGSPLWNTSLPSSSLPVTINGVTTTFNNLITGTGTSYYRVPSLSGKIYVGTNANVILWVTGSSSFSGSDQITIAQGGSLTIYVGSQLNGPYPQNVSFTMTGQAAINNLNPNAANFTMLGEPTCTSIGLNGNANITGVVYAPEANLTMGGGGNDHYDFVGSAMGKNITMNGHMKFHYDEALKNRGFARGYIPSNWKEASL